MNVEGFPLALNPAVGTTAPATKLDTLGTIRSTAQTTPTGGEGVELAYQGGQGYLIAYRRSAPAYLPLNVEGATLALNPASGGNVGVGTATPQARLHVNGSLAADGNVGIGVVVPQAKLHVAGNVGIGISAPTPYRLDVQGGATRLKSSDQFPLTLEAGNALIPYAAVMQFRRHDGVPTWQFGAGAVGGVIQEFGLRDDIAGVWRLYVGPSGNVGIGRTDPVSKLHVQGPFTAEGSITASNGPISTTGGYDIVSSGKYFAVSKLIADSAGCYYA